MRTEPYQYDNYMGMFIKVLGWEAAQDGEGAEPFLQAVRSFDENKGCFSTWLYHNLRLHLLQKNGKHAKQPKLVPMVEGFDVEGSPNPAFVLEFRDEMKQLSEDCKTIIAWIFQENEEKKTKRTVWPDGPACDTPQGIRKQIKIHCRETLQWSWPRYWKAIHEIKEILK